MAGDWGTDKFKGKKIGSGFQKAKAKWRDAERFWAQELVTYCSHVGK